MNEFMTVERQGGLLEISLKDHWVFANLNALQRSLDDISLEGANRVRFYCGGLRDFDLAGAWVLYDKSMDFEEREIEADFEGFKASHLKFLSHIIDIAAQKEYIPGFFDPLVAWLDRARIPGAASPQGLAARARSKTTPTWPR